MALQWLAFFQKEKYVVENELCRSWSSTETVKTLGDAAKPIQPEKTFLRNGVETVTLFKRSYGASWVPYKPYLHGMNRKVVVNHSFLYNINLGLR